MRLLPVACCAGSVVQPDLAAGLAASGLALHDESVKAMRFPMNQHRLELKNAQEAREREMEMAKEIQEGDLDEDDLGGEFDGM
ncbi:hypothetical protein BN1723_011333 [Verticillium longisporum]|uniref:26S proteasome non-ATPase regulatory subunit 3 C-terminal domain-containing protein n=1 Tax=Verticillium longisporum TaxID=100787 RepID=A0A0G4L694_VERLO|nr:hypothetical protein BN1723_011333 [Verticillium longisporum]